ncbi:hypothetical protein TD95_001962 [Thielaviopsis punctulata]|uniref:HECT-type E3 ubiquitin transferase n=1 Tax=Thielaviopsis punctulata TaxID=72032 RepID=A0A0F4ZFJ4_9PEZI|nr:hypothetical protein TD95_001962 [Thielaviopsis punctulata]
MVKITRTMQPKHRAALTPWLKNYVQEASVTPLPKLAKKLATFPSAWPFPRGDLYHWIPLLNRFDNILETFVNTYHLNNGPQTEDFRCDLLLNQPKDLEFCDTTTWTTETLANEGYGAQGDEQLMESVLRFTAMLLDRCGNRSIYASSSYLNDLLFTYSLPILLETLQVGSKLAHRYQASVKRLGSPNNSRQISALLANHYNIDLERVQLLTHAFTKTPLANSHATTATPSAKGKEKMHHSHGRSSGSKHANNLLAILGPDGALWDGWGDVRVVYYASTPGTEDGQPSASAIMHTPTPLRRSSTSGSASNTPKIIHQSGVDDAFTKTPRSAGDALPSSQKIFEVSQADVINKSIGELVAMMPENMADFSRYEALHRLRVAKALLGTPETREKILAIRLLAVLNLTYIHPESTFVEKVLRNDADEIRKYQLVYQLAELIHPTIDTSIQVPLWIQSIAMSLLENISMFESRFNDVFSALNANVNHGVLLYVVRKAVAGIKEDSTPIMKAMEMKSSEVDDWRRALFALTLHMSMNTRVGQEMAAAGLVEALIETLGFTTPAAKKLHSMFVQFLDNLVLNYQPAFNTFFSINGLDAISKLVVDTVSEALESIPSNGISSELKSDIVDYNIPFWQQSTLKWVLKFVHHILSNWYNNSGNADRLLRNLADKSDFLRTLRTIMESVANFGSAVWTHAVMILSDFINNDPTSFAAIMESGMIRSFLESISDCPIPDVNQPGEEERERQSEGADENHDSMTFEPDTRPHPPPREILAIPRSRPLAKGISPTSEAIKAIPTALGSICLNKAGLKMAVESRAIETLLETFESPAHLACMAHDRNLSMDLGRTFDELARHHPPLKQSIANAVIDMTARVCEMGRDIRTVEDWGTHLFVLDVNGKRVHCNKDLLQNLKKAEAEPKSGEETQKDEEPKKDTFEYTVCVQELSTFLEMYLSNVTLRREFANQGGMRILLDILESPSLHSKSLSPETPLNTLFSVVARIAEQPPAVYMPQLLHRTIDALTEVFTIVNPKNGDPSFFAAFLRKETTMTSAQFESLSAEEQRVLVNGEGAARALVKAQMLLLTICCTFPSVGRGQPQAQFHNGNLFDFHIKIIQECGALVRMCLKESSQMNMLVPKHWQPLYQSNADVDATILSATTGDGLVMNPLLSDIPEYNVVDALGISEDDDTGSKPPATEDAEVLKKNIKYQNYHLLKFLLDTAPAALPSLLAVYGKAVFPRRYTSRDKYVKSQHLLIAKALGATMMDYLRLSVEETGASPTVRDYVYWIKMVQFIEDSVHDGMPDLGPMRILMPTFLSLQYQGLFPVLNAMATQFSKEISRCQDSTPKENPGRIAVYGLRKILEFYVMLITMKTTESLNSSSIIVGTEVREPVSRQVLDTEIRVAIGPTILCLWKSDALNKLSRSLVASVITILRQVTNKEADSTSSYRLSAPICELVFKHPVQEFKFDDLTIKSVLQQLSNLDVGDDVKIPLAIEGVFRCLNTLGPTVEYCQAHISGRAGPRNPLPDGITHEYNPDPQSSTQVGEPMAVDSVSQLLGDNDNDGYTSNHSVESNDDDNSQAEGTAAENANTADGQSGPRETILAVENRKKIEALRTDLQATLVDRTLEVLSSHSNAAVEVSELVLNILTQEKSEEEYSSVGSTIIFALCSLSDDAHERGDTISAYAHLLALLLQDRSFFNCNFATLKETLGQYISFLSPIETSSEGQLPLWFPYILLIVEILLSHDQQPQESKLAPPGEESSVPGKVVLVTPKSVFTMEQCRELLNNVLSMLPRIGKQDTFATATLRVLVILTREREFATIMGERKNLQRLFVMVKQLASTGAERLRQSKVNQSVMIILRHIIEDDETVKQIMRYEIKNYFDNPTRSARVLDVQTYIKALPMLVLRSPKLFVEISNEMLKFVRWTTSTIETGRGNILGLKSSETPANAEPASENAEETATESKEAEKKEDESTGTVKPSTEAAEDVDMTSQNAKSAEKKVPVLENPDGVIHFLLCELVNYREVEDKEVPAEDEVKVDKESASASSSKQPPGESCSNKSGESPAEADKKPLSKLAFKPEDHPIFVYRCFLLNTVTELLQSYNRTKMEFINFKRSAPVQNHTPVRPRSSVLNYLISDLLCQGTLNGNPESLSSKKKLATAAHVQRLLLALVSRTTEKFQTPHKHRYDYDNDADLLFVRTFVVDTILKAYERATVPDEPVETRYLRMQCLSELMNFMVGDKERDAAASRVMDPSLNVTYMQIRRMMFEKGYIEKLTASIAEIDLNYPGVKRSIKYILRVLRVLTDTAKELSISNLITTGALPDYEDDLESASSLSELEDGREDTPDLYRNTTLGISEIRDEDDISEDEDVDDDEEMYEDEYGEEMDFDEEEMSAEDDENVSDDSEEELEQMEGMSDMGPIEGLPGHPSMLEVVMDDDEDMDEDEDDDDDDDDEDDDMDDDEIDLDDIDEHVHQEIRDEDGNIIEDDGDSAWESESQDGVDDHHDHDHDEEIDEEEFETQMRDEEEAEAHELLHSHRAPEEDALFHLSRVIMGDEGYGNVDMDVMGDHYADMEGDEEEDEMDEDEEYDFDEQFASDDHQPSVGSTLGWDSLLLEGSDAGVIGSARRNRVSRRMPSALSRWPGRDAPDYRFWSHMPPTRSHGTRVPGSSDEGANPLLRPNVAARDAQGRSGTTGGGLVSINLPSDMFGSLSSRFGGSFNPSNSALVLQELLSNMPDMNRGHYIQFHNHLGHSGVHEWYPSRDGRLPTNDWRRDGSAASEPSQAVGFVTARTRDRYQEEASMIHTSHVVDRALRVSVLITALLTPAAQEEDKKRRAAEELKKKERMKELEEQAAHEAAKRERKRQEEQERAEREAAAAAAAAAAEAAAVEAAAAEAAAAATDTGSSVQAENNATGEGMEGVETTTTAATASASESADTIATPSATVAAAPAPSQPRVLTTIRGEQVDVTELGIDPDYLAALPEEFREEVIAQTVSTRRSQAREQSHGTQNEEFQEFLDALPGDLREEIIHQERQDQRRRAREEQRRASHAAVTSGNTAGVSGTAADASAGGTAGSSAAAAPATASRTEENEMDAASILMTFPPELRNEVLLDQPQEFLDRLPPSIAAEARLMHTTLPSNPAASVRHPSAAIVGHTHTDTSLFPPSGPIFTSRNPWTAIPAHATGPFARFLAERPARRTGVVQMLDKAGVATLLRLMFIGQHGSIRSSLFNVLADVCENRQNRIEVISTVLQILQDGSTDMDAVERSFSQLSLKAKRPRELPQGTLDSPKAPQTGVKRSATLAAPLPAAGSSSGSAVSSHSEISPLMIVQQCLDLLSDLSTKSPQISHLFLTEHDLSGYSLKRALTSNIGASGRSRSKTRLSKDAKAQRFAINSLLSLLDRDLVMESSMVMTILAELIYRLTVPLQNMERRRREAEQQHEEAQEKEKQKEKEEADAAAAGAGSSAAGASANPSISASTGASAPAATDKKESEEVAKKPSKPIQMPIIPHSNLTLVVKIFVARECSSKTFQNTISAIKNLSAIPGAKAVFGQELVSQAHILAGHIAADLDGLLPCIEQASSGTEIQGIALAKFSPGTSEQNKLLRVLTALDHLFDTRKKTDNGKATGSGSSAGNHDETDKHDLVLALYKNTGFSTMWEKLSVCLRVIRQRENMINVATILLPLIESLMVVCKNTTAAIETDAPAKGSSLTVVTVTAPSSPKESGIGAGDVFVTSPRPQLDNPQSFSAAQQHISNFFFNFTGEHRRILNELVRNNPKLMSANFSLLVKNPTVLEFDNKRNYFTRSVHSRNNQQSRNFPQLQLSVRRNMVFHDSYRALYFKSGEEMKYGKLNIRFHGEEGVDAGGVTREWFQVLSRQMFDANYALFTPVSSDRTTFHPNKLSAVNDQHLLYFKFVGRIIGKALYEGRVLDCHFSRAVYKRILGKSVSVKDMESFDPDYYKSLLWMLDNDITDIIVETFSVEDEEFGVTTIVDLVPDGRNIAVTEENKKDYVRLVVEHKLLSSVKEQMEHFLKGFHDIIPAELISIFNEQELELLISGLPDVDIDDWKAYTEYHNYTAASQQIQWFWRAVRSFDKEELAKLLQFVTGTSKVPLNGFKELEGMNGVSRFNIHRDYGNKSRLPSSHTCFNQLDLPEYESYEVLRTQLLKAITAGNDYFGFA